MALIAKVAVLVAVLAAVAWGALVAYHHRQVKYPVVELFDSAGCDGSLSLSLPPSLSLSHALLSLTIAMITMHRHRHPPPSSLGSPSLYHLICHHRHPTTQRHRHPHSYHQVLYCHQSHLLFALQPLGLESVFEGRAVTNHGAVIVVLGARCIYFLVCS